MDTCAKSTAKLANTLSGTQLEWEGEFENSIPPTGRCG